jgi:hypothetical protein
MPDVSLDSISGPEWLTNGVVVAATMAIFALLMSPAMRRSRPWQATVTPLASIIGSGFLVVAPLLAHMVGHWALAAMLAIVILAYAVGSAVRYNITHLEAISDSEKDSSPGAATLKWLERIAKVLLALAYVIAITFYLELLAAFVLQLFDMQDRALQKGIGTALVIFIGLFGYWRGLSSLENLEKYSVDTKLAIIAGFLAGLAVVNAHHVIAGTWAMPRMDVTWDTNTLRRLLGAFLIVQGFETCRYMGNAYRKEERVVAMRHAQLIAGAIYFTFIALASILFGSFGEVSETGIIDLSAQVAVIVPFLLIIGAATAQFSAAVADTLASGGLVEAATRGRFSHRHVYLVVMLLSATLLWTGHIFTIISYASRAFAAYYAVQCIMAAAHAAMAGSQQRSIARASWFAFLALVMLAAAMFGIPAESFDDG